MSGKESFEVGVGVGVGGTEPSSISFASPRPASRTHPPRALVQRLRGALHAGHRFQTAPVFLFFVFCGAKDFQIF